MTSLRLVQADERPITPEETLRRAQEACREAGEALPVANVWRDALLTVATELSVTLARQEQDDV